MNASKSESKGKGARKERDFDVGKALDILVTVALWLVGLSFVCLVTGHPGWCLVLLLVGGVIDLLVVALLFLASVFMAKVLKNIPHR